MSTRVATMPSPFGAAAPLSAPESCGKLSWFTSNSPKPGAASDIGLSMPPSSLPKRMAATSCLLGKVGSDCGTTDRCTDAGMQPSSPLPLAMRQCRT
eukprot:453177-Heterocapsa_arctica.AAC.1